MTMDLSEATTLSPKTTSEAANWMAAAKPGDKLIYHTGISSAGCDPGVRAQVYAWWEAGLVALVQKRDGKVFNYAAIRLDGKKKR